MPVTGHNLHLDILRNPRRGDQIDNTGEENKQTLFINQDFFLLLPGLLFNEKRRRTQCRVQYMK